MEGGGDLGPTRIGRLLNDILHSRHVLHQLGTANMNSQMH